MWNDIIDLVNSNEDIDNDSKDIIDKVESENEPVDANKKYALLALIHLANTMRKNR